ncbi:hypothetical protein FHG87_024114 [Trinorchestia longiramus]|nr:hypothetical protein FHG87_024114 [Trinorchestia longiramus]
MQVWAVENHEDLNFRTEQYSPLRAVALSHVCLVLFTRHMAMLAARHGEWPCLSRGAEEGGWRGGEGYGAAIGFVLFRVCESLRSSGHHLREESHVHKRQECNCLFCAACCVSDAYGHSLNGGQFQWLLRSLSKWRLDVLVLQHSQGAPRTRTVEGRGLERTMAGNYFGHFLLTNLLFCEYQL